MTTGTAVAPAPIVRNNDLDELMVETVAALTHVTHRLEAALPVTPGDLAQAHFDNSTIQRYLSTYYPSGHGTSIADTATQFRWTLDQAAMAGLTSVG